MRKFLLALIVISSITADAQNVGVGTTTPAAKLDITSSNSGILIPRIALTGSNDVSTVPSPVNATLIFNTATVTGANAVSPGFYWWNSTLSVWTKVLDNASTPGDTNIYNTDGTLTGNRTVTMGNDNITFSSVNGNFIYNTTGIGNIAMGYNASATSGYDVAIGYNALANGGWSTALGPNDTASGSHSLALGYQNSAIGVGVTVAMGSNSKAIGSGSMAIGSFAIANGLNSVAMGNSTNANGWNSTTMGNNTTAASYGEMVAGQYNTAYTPVSTSSWNVADRLFGIGNGTSAGATSDALVVLKNGDIGIGTSTPTNKLEVVGNTKTTNLQMTTGATANYLLQSDASGNATWVNPNTIAANNIYNSDGTLTGNRTVTMGADNLTLSATTGNLTYNPSSIGNVSLGHNASATSGYDVAIGYNALANGGWSTALGPNDTASGSHSLALGYQNSAIGVGVTVAMGSNSKAIGSGSMAIGSFAIANGLNSVAMGNSTNANGWNSTTMGNNTTAASYGEMVAGQYNTAYTPVSTSSWNVADRLFGIGNGTSAGATSDALVVLKNGDIGIGTSTPTNKLEVVGNTKTTNLQMTTGATANYLLQSDASGNATWVNPNTIAANNIYNSNGTLTGSRTVTMGANNLTFSGTTANFNVSLASFTAGQGSIGLGYGVTSNGGASFASGYFTTASGQNGTAMGGPGTVASGQTTTAIGAADTASGSYSTAFGQHTHALSYNETSLGSYNTYYTPASTTTWNAADRLFGIGNGTSSTAYSDALVILKNGKTGIATASPLSTLDVNGGTLVRGANTNTLTAPISAVEFATGRQQNGTMAPNTTTADIAFQYGGGGFRHFIQTRHFSGVGYNTNAIDFYLNNSNTSTGSSAPGTGNVNIMTLTPVGVGVNTNAPFSMLTVSGANSNSISYLDASSTANLTIAGTTNLVRMQMGVGGASLGPYGSWIQSTYDNSGSSNGTEPLMLNPSGGNVGVGNTAPGAELEVSTIVGNLDTPEIRVSSVNGGWSPARLTFYSDRGSAYEWRPAYIQSGDNNPGLYGGRLDFVTNGYGPGNKTSNVTAMSVYNGMVGIGIVAPTHPLDVVGDINTSLGFTIAGAATSGNYLRGNGTNFVSSAIQAGDIPSGSGNYIENQTIQQTASFNISGTGLIANTLGVGSTSPTFNTANGSRVYVDGYDYSDANVALIKAVKTGNSLTTTGHSAIMGMADNYGGSGVGLNVSSRGVCGYTNAVSAPYTWGVAGYRVGTVTGGPSAGVMGAVSDVAAPSVWGALGYQDASSNQYGMFATGNAYVSGNLGVGIAPAAPLEVSSTGDNPYLQLNTTATNKRTRINFSQSGTIGMEIGTDYAVANVNDLYIYNRATGSTAAYFYPGNQVWMSARATNSDFYINNSGYIGIGTTTPKYPLDIETTSANNTTAYAYINGMYSALGITYAGGGGYGGGNATGANVVSLYLAGRLFQRAGEIDFGSDNRIKDIIGLSNGSDDLATLQKVQVTDFTYKDVVENGTKPKKAFIAQQVESVFPEAVTYNTDFIPDVYVRDTAKYFDAAHGTCTIYLAKNHNLQVGDTIRIIGDDGKTTTRVTDVPSPSAITVRWDREPSKLMFVYGRQVHDFRAVDYDRIYNLNVSATQELAKQLHQEQMKNQQLEQELADVKKQGKTSQSDIDKLKASIETLQQILQSKAEK